MKLGYLITHLRISDSQCNGATHTDQQGKNSKHHHQTEKSWQPSGTGRDHFSSIFCLEETLSMLAAYCETLKKLSGSSKEAERNADGRSLLTAQQCPSTHCSRHAELLQSFKWEVLAHPPHIPDLASSVYLLFSKLKESLAGKTFSDDDEFQHTVMTWLREQAGDFYDTGIKTLVPRLTKCIAIHGDHVE
jgi:hypothetical protein